MATIESRVLQTITPVTHDLGDFKVNRTLPSNRGRWSARSSSSMSSGRRGCPAGQGMDVRPHPHINLATVTYLFEGAIEHRDSIGSHAVIEPGAINLMTAGSGIVHSERSPEALRAEGPRLYGMQTWLALPDGARRNCPGVRPCRSGRAAAGRGRRRERPSVDGNFVGSDGGDAAAIRRRSMPTSSSATAARFRSMPMPTSAR